MSQSNQILKAQRIRLLFFFVTLIAMLTILLWVNNLLVSVFLAFVGFFLMKPFVDFLEHRGLNRLVSTSLPFLFFSLVILAFCLIFIPKLSLQFELLKNELPKYVAGTQDLIRELEIKLETFMSISSKNEISNHVQHRVQDIAQNIFKDLPAVLSSSLTILFLAPFLTFFMLLEGRSFARKLVSVVPNAYFELSLYLQHQMVEQMGGFIRARLLQSVVISFIIWFGLIIMNFPYALVLSFFAGLLNVIPYIGPVIGFLPALIIALVNKEPSSLQFWLLFIYLLAQIIDAVILVPFLVARIVNLHAVTVVIAIMIGSQLMGTLGMIISVPVASAVKVIFSALYTHFTDNEN